jgi:hypothetical protein
VPKCRVHGLVMPSRVIGRGWRCGRCRPVSLSHHQHLAGRPRERMRFWQVPGFRFRWVDWRSLRGRC